MCNSFELFFSVETFTLHRVIGCCCISHVVVPSVGHDGRRSGGKPQLFASKGRNRLLPFQLTAQGDEEDKRSPAALTGS